MLQLFDDVLDGVSKNSDVEAVWRSLGENYKRLIGDENEESAAVGQGLAGGKFSSEVKSALSLLEIASVAKCPLCGGLLHPNGKVMDHIEKKSDGGSAGIHNGRWVHPVCNSERDRDEQDAFTMEK